MPIRSASPRSLSGMTAADGDSPHRHEGSKSASRRGGKAVSASTSGKTNKPKKSKDSLRSKKSTKKTKKSPAVNPEAARRDGPDRAAWMQWGP